MEGKEGEIIISVIVPVYNVGRYLQQALEAIRTQTFTDWECIIINDGSTDNSGKICDSFVSKDSRFKVIHKDNGGVSSARNAGLDNAKGEYITFVDPDDWPEPHFLETLYSLIKKYDADVAQCGYYRELRGLHKSKPIVNKERVLNREEAIQGLLSKNVLPSYLWTKLFKKEIITRRFPEGKTYEDAYTMPYWFLNVNKVAVSPALVYHYRLRKQSITKVGLAKNHYNYVMACKGIADLVHTHVPDRFPLSRRNAYIIGVAVDGAKTIARKEPDKKLRKEGIESISRIVRELEFPDQKDLHGKLRRRGKILRDNPGLFSFLMKSAHMVDFYSLFRSSRYYE